MKRKDFSKKKAFIDEMLEDVQPSLPFKNMFYNRASELYYERFNEEWSATGIRKFIENNKVLLSKKRNTRIYTKSQEVDQNTLDTMARTKMYLTEDEMAMLFKIDRTIWKSKDITTNRWAMTNKHGESYYNHQTKITWVRIIPISTEIPPLQSVTINTNKFDTPVSTPLTGEFKKTIVFGDSQNGYHKDVDTGSLNPFHDRRCWHIALQIIRDEQPDRIVLMGDMIDLPEWTDKFLKRPEFYYTTQPALEELYWWLLQIRMIVPNAEIDYLEGNHEFRLSRAVITHLLAAYALKPANNPQLPILSLENLLGLKELGINYHAGYPGNNLWLNENFELQHGYIVRKKSGDTTKAIITDASNSSMVAHGHRQEMSSRTLHPYKGPRTYTSFMLGTFSRIDGTCPSHTGKENWQQGCGLIYHNDKLFDVHLISINNGVATLNGRVYKGNYDMVTKELNKDTNNKWRF